MARLSEKRIADNEAVKNRNLASKPPQVKYKNQDNEYNNAYRKWRSESRIFLGHPDPDNPNEMIYKDGVGIIAENRTAAERRTLVYVHSVIMWAMVFYLVIELCLSSVLPPVIGKLGAHIGTDAVTGLMYGNDVTVIIIMYLCETVKQLIPFLMVKKALNMPINIVLPMKIYDREAFGIAIPAALMCFPLLSAFSGLFNRLLSTVGILPYNNIVPHMNTMTGSVASVIISVIYVPIVSELLMRGMILHSLRQFGDAYAILISALVSTLCVHNLTQMCYVFISAIVIGHFALRTGSMITAVIMRMIFKLAATSAWYAERYLPAEDNILFIGIVFTVFLTVGLIGILRFIGKSRKGIGLTAIETELTLKEKLPEAFFCPPSLLFMATSAALMIISLNVV
ncbi:MAG: CPBP family intramembrane metalloprotease [Oscillospiraceae bacterium]|nr:CPBP family intramembrane metalloprotease [Oscillospiraceae bacterium]